MTGSTLALVALALLAGLAVGVLLGAGTLRRDRASVADHVAATVEATGRVVRPVGDSLTRFEHRLRELEHDSVAAQASLSTQIESVRRSGDDLRREAAGLTTALRKPHARGQWGELHLRRTVELAGLQDRVDFDTQTTVPGDGSVGGGAIRPDLVVHLPGSKNVVVDAKVPLASFLEAQGSETDDEAAALRAAHARQVRTHVDGLASKRYWSRLSSTPEFVVMFLPGESFLSTALEAEPGLLEYALAKKVVPATPTTLVALLRTVAITWSQAALAENARDVFEVAREVYDRVGVFSGHLAKVGRALDTSVLAYNAAVGSLEERLLRSARKLAELNLAERELTAPVPVTTRSRPLTASEVLHAADPVESADPDEPDDPYAPPRRSASG